MKNKKSYTSNKAVIFARVSSLEQKDNNSLDAQVFKMKEYCTRKGFEIVKQMRLVESSTRGERKEFYQLIDFVRNQKDHIHLVVDAVDRLQRSFNELPIISEIVDRGKLTVHFLREGKVFNKKSNSSDIFSYQASVMVANAYTNAISDNVKRGFDEKRRKGEVLGHVPIGYLNKDKDVVLDEVRSVLVKKLFEDYSTGLYSSKELLLKYGKLGLTNLKSGKYLSNSQVDRMITHPFYYGMIEDIDEDDNNILREHKYPKIITKALFDKCKNAKIGRGHNKYKLTKESFTFKGLVKCEACKCSYSPYIKKGHTYLRPNNAKTKCTACKNISEVKILKTIESAIKQLSFSNEVLLAIKDELKKSTEVEHKEYSIIISKLQTEQTSIKNKIYNWNLRCADDLSITTEERQEFLKPLKLKAEQIETELKALNRDNKTFEITLDVMLDLASKSYLLFKSSRNEEKREILKILFSNLFMNGEILHFSYAKPFNLFVKNGEFQEWSG